MDNTSPKYFAFVLMPFHSDYDDIYKIGIKETAAELGIKAERLDEQIFVEGMIDRVYRQIDVADIIVADMSGKNPNVFYEVGYAHAKDKLCILLTNDTNDIPFDLKQRRHIVYGNSISTLKTELSKNLKWAINEIEKVTKSKIRIDFKQPDATLVTNSYTANVSLNFKIDFFNDNLKKATDINAIYLYSEKEWNVKQADKECPSTKADLDNYNYCYFIVPPIKLLAPKTWAQLQFTTSRVVAMTWKGDVIRDSYNINGRSILRFVTSDGIFDYELNFSAEAIEIPF